MSAFRLFVTLFCCYQSWAWYRDVGHYGILELAILPFHEAGHFAFSVTGNQFLTVAGGTIVQIGLPLAFAVYFAAWRRDFFAAAFALFWTFETMMNVSWYMADARKMLLPLLGDEEGHDWNYLLGQMRVLNRADVYAWRLRMLAGLGMFLTLSLQVGLLAPRRWFIAADRASTESPDSPQEAPSA